MSEQLGGTSMQLDGQAKEEGVGSRKRKLQVQGSGLDVNEEAARSLDGNEEVAERN